MRYLIAQYSNFGLQLLELLLFTVQKVPREEQLAANTHGCQKVGVSQLVITAAKVASFDPAFINQCPQAVIDFAHTYAQSFCQTTLAGAGLRCDLPEKFVVELVVRHVLGLGWSDSFDRHEIATMRSSASKCVQPMNTSTVACTSYASFTTMSRSSR